MFCLKKGILILLVITTYNAGAQTKDDFSLTSGLSSVYMIDDAETYSISPENPTGEKGKGGMAIPNANDTDLPFSKQAEHLGQGWKVRPFIKLKPAAKR